MKKTIIKSTIYLILVSIMAKLLSFIVRILLARSLSSDAMNLYSLASPTMVFVITLAQMGIPSALSKVIAQSEDTSKPLRTSILISFFNNIIVSILFLIAIPFLSMYILKQDEMRSVLYAIVPLIPMVSISGILKGYLFGIQQHITATSCQIFEELARILFLVVMFLTQPQMSVVQMAEVAMFSITIGEICSSFFMFMSLHHKKNKLLHLPMLFQNLHRNNFDEVLSISIPMTGSRLIGSLTYFLEPIVMVVGLLAVEQGMMVNAYGQLNGYVIPIITMPSFITITLSNFLLPSFTYHYTRGNTTTAGKLFWIIVICCSLTGFGCAFMCYSFSDELMMLFYNTSNGAELLKMLAWPFAFYALQPPLSSMLHALSYSRKAMLDTFLGSLTRILCVALLTPLIHIYALVVGLLSGMIITTFLHAIHLSIAFKKH